MRHLYLVFASLSILLLLSGWSFRPAVETTVVCEQTLTLKPLKPKVKKTKKKATPPHDYGDRTQLSAFLLCILLGFAGAHQFYLGHSAAGITQAAFLACIFLLLIWGTGLGVALAFVFGLALGIWILVDLLMLTFGTMKPKKSKRLVPWD